MLYQVEIIGKALKSIPAIVLCCVLISCGTDEAAMPVNKEVIAINPVQSFGNQLNYSGLFFIVNDKQSGNKSS